MEKEMSGGNRSAEPYTFLTHARESGDRVTGEPPAKNPWEDLGRLISNDPEVVVHLIDGRRLEGLVKAIGEGWLLLAFDASDDPTWVSMGAIATLSIVGWTCDAAVWRGG